MFSLTPRALCETAKPLTDIDEHFERAVALLRPRLIGNQPWRDVDDHPITGHRVEPGRLHRKVQFPGWQTVAYGMCITRSGKELARKLVIRLDGKLVSGPIPGAQSVCPFVRDHLYK